jgi:hypothetical protein
VAATAAPTLDARNTIPARLEKLGMSQGFFAELCGSNKAEFSRLMNGIKPMSGSQTREFYAMLDSLEELTKFLEPMTWTWTDPQATREWLENPRFPSLFRILTDAQLRQLNTQDLTKLAAISAEGDRIQAETEATCEESQKLFLEWLSENHQSGR